jgi:NADH-quinone oxidoreductase subunit D
MAATNVGEPRELLTVNMGPQHPSTHGVLRLELVLDGEVVVHCRPVIGYLHTGIEKTFEAKTYVQGVVLTDRMDYLNPLGNNLAYALSIEKLIGCDIPERATVLRVLLAELTRIASHLMFIGSMALDLGATSPFLYCWREREKILDFFESMSGVRMMTSFIRPGGLLRDLSSPLLDNISEFVDAMPAYIDSYEELLTGNPIFKERTEGVGLLSAADALSLGVSGPILRASGVALDMRKANPYCGYDTYDFGVPTGTVGDVYDRYLVRVAEMRESVRICRQSLDRLPGGPVQGHAAASRRARQKHGGGDSSLQTVDRGHSAASRGSICGHRIAPRRAWLLRRQRWFGSADSRPRAGAFVRQSPGAAAYH